MKKTIIMMSLLILFLLFYSCNMETENDFLTEKESVPIAGYWVTTSGYSPDTHVNYFQTNGTFIDYVQYRCLNSSTTGKWMFDAASQTLTIDVTGFDVFTGAVEKVHTNEFIWNIDSPAAYSVHFYRKGCEPAGSLKLIHETIE